MKVRWNRTSIRLRITPGELSALQRGDPIAERLSFFGAAEWAVHVVPCPEIEMTGLTGDRSDIWLRLALADIARLSSPENEGIYFAEPLRQQACSVQTGDVSSSPMLRYFIEKDFPCIHPRAIGANEPEYETFAAPEGFAERHSRRGC